MTECTAQHVLDYDSLYCQLEDGHTGPHHTSAIDGPIWWQIDRTWRRHD